MISVVHRIFPPGDPTDAEIGALYGGVRPAVEGRPWAGLSMITSLDGATAVDGLSGGLGNANDRAVFGALRAAADVIVVGARTATAEGYRPTARPGQRIAVVTSSGLVDTSGELFTSGCAFLVVPDDVGAIPTGVESIRAGQGSVDLAGALRQFTTIVPSARFVLAEGGPRLNGALLDAGCLDELDLTIAPALVGGDSSRIVAGATELRRSWRLVHVLTDEDGYLFTRWVRSG